MKAITKKDAEALLKSKSAFLEWNTISAKYFLRVQVSYLERVKLKLDSSYRLAYKTGLILDKNNIAITK